MAERPPVSLAFPAMTSEFPTPEMALTHILVVSDVEVSATWYRDVLGAEPYRSYGSSSVFRFNDAWLLLVTAGGPTEDKPDVWFEPPSGAAVSHSFTIRVADCQAAYDTLRARGARFLSPPKDWGAEIRCFFPDPDGHLWEISEAG
jgi:catechol 2,3-dioxygenase-like lactoylglutathione lyase family enzyme